jgi:SNF2 family DNA or RNA helicase
VPKFFRQAEEMLMDRINQYKLAPKRDAVETAFKMLQPSVRFDLDAVVELPELVSRTIDVPLSATQKKAYEALSKEFQAQINGATITAVNAAVAMGKLLQLSGGWVYAGKDNNGVSINIPLGAHDRVDAMLDIINEAEHKVLLFVPYLHTIAGVSEALDNAGVEHAVVHGGITKRDEIFNHFQNTDKYKVLLAHPQCLAHGLTLTAADTIIWYLPITSLEIYDQANARISRVGQRHRQQIFHLQSTPVEKKIYGMLRTKQRIQEALLDLLEEATTARGMPDAA